MFSIRTVLFLSCAALAVAYPPLFRFSNREGGQREQEQPLIDGRQPMDQVGPGASPSYDYGGGGDAGAGGGTSGATETQSSESAEAAGDGGSVGASQVGADDGAAGNEAGEAGETEAAETNDSPDAVRAGGAAGSPDGLDGGPSLTAKGQKSSAGQKAGIAVGVVAMVGLAAGIGYFVYRKRRAAAYGARF